MKKRIFLIALMIAMLVCLLAICVSAEEAGTEEPETEVSTPAVPDTSKETVTLDDGTVCALYDTDGVGLIWYLASTDESGKKIYGYVPVTSESVYIMSTGGGSTEVNNIYIIVDGVTYDKNTLVVLNLREAKITGGKDGRMGNDAAFIYKVFSSSTNLEYLYANLNTTSFGLEAIKGCSNLKYVNFNELTNLKSIGQQAFINCTRLYENRVLDFSNTKLESTETNSLRGNAATEVILPETFTTLGQETFKDCKYLTKATFKGTLTSISNNIFDNCSEITEIVGFNIPASATSIGNYSFNNCKKLKRIDGLMQDGILIIPEGIKSLGELAFYECDQIKYVEFPSTINYVGQACFAWCDNLVLASFDKVDAKIKNAIANGETYTKVTFNNCGTFKGCPKLVAMSVPEGTTSIINRFVAQGCTSLTAFYMPSTISGTFKSNGGGQGPFCGATSMYFVSESFTVGQCLVDGQVDTTKLVLPKKPSVYFMPSGLTSFSGHVQTNQNSKSGTIFQNCYNLNETIVFGESFTDMNGNNAFNGIGNNSAKNIVFLGNMTGYVTTQNAKNVSFIFANSADKSPADIGIIHVYKNNNNSNSYMYFCTSGLKYNYSVASAEITEAEAITTYIKGLEGVAEVKHVQNPLGATSQDANCLDSAMTFKTCFCGTKFDIEADEAKPALGHDYDFSNITGIVYADYTKDGVFTCGCHREGCEGVKDEAIKDSYLFIYLGYSKNADGDMCVGYTVNEEFLEYYKALKQASFSFGLVGTVIDFDENGMIAGEDTPLAENYAGKITRADLTSHTGLVGYDMIIKGFGEAHSALYLAMNLYVIDGESTYYIWDGAEAGTNSVVNYKQYSALPTE